jgi:hypothetical protein
MSLISLKATCNDSMSLGPVPNIVTPNWRLERQRTNLLGKPAQIYFWHRFLGDI